ncbi:unnamed protein product [Phytophthora fragariaefolia]|uniref:Unnamed protein product n=1 Tax=Phytophthora fragariaefolia TaxID=1490495 RepID=A0A9W7CJ56_9STRA|nr:unnamed protein product [Phytophthora fragariaefolia]
MQLLWATLERDHCGIFESPTGTDKSISLISLIGEATKYGLLRASADVDTNPAQHPQPKKSAKPSWLSDFEQKTAGLELKFRQQTVKEALVGIEKLRLGGAEAIVRCTLPTATASPSGHVAAAERASITETEGRTLGG